MYNKGDRVILYLLLGYSPVLGLDTIAQSGKDTISIRTHGVSFSVPLKMYFCYDCGSKLVKNKVICEPKRHELTKINRRTSIYSGFYIRGTGSVVIAGYSS